MISLLVHGVDLANLKGWLTIGNTLKKLKPGYLVENFFVLLVLCGIITTSFCFIVSLAMSSNINT
jgi:hypothetical protein